jgi:hypothetical protein
VTEKTFSDDFWSYTAWIKADSRVNLAYQKTIGAVYIYIGSNELMN